MKAYLKEAFLFRWNLLFFLGGTAAAALTPLAAALLPVVAAGELAYLAGLVSIPKFREAIDAKTYAAAKGTPMAAMTLYDPFLQLYLLPGDQQEALTINGYAKIINKTLAHLYRAGKFRVAHVDEAFKTYDTTPTTTLAGQPGLVPVAVAEVCRLTWMCAPAPVGPNIHANEAGYGVIAGAFARAFGRLRQRPRRSTTSVTVPGSSAIARA